VQREWVLRPRTSGGRNLKVTKTSIELDIPLAKLNRINETGIYGGEGGIPKSSRKFPLFAQCRVPESGWVPSRWMSWGIVFGLVMLASAHAQDIHLKIIALNDFHGNLESPGTFRADAQSPEVPVGGADYMAAYIARLKSENPLNVVVSAGDVTGGSPLISALFDDEDTVAVMNQMGLEINGVGNHEFDKGKQELLRRQYGCLTRSKDTCKASAAAGGGPFEKAKFEYLSANVLNTSTGKTLFPGYAIRTYDGFKVAFIGVTLKDTPTIVIPSAVAGLRFTDEASSINAIVQKLKGQGVDGFVVLIHQGGSQTGGFTGAASAADINGCAGGLDGTPIQPIVNRLDDAVDLVISAHTHMAYNCMVANSAGRKVPVTSASAYGRMLTDIDLTVDRKTEHVTQVTPRNLLVDRTNPEIVPDAAVKTIVDRYAALAAPIANRVVGSITAEITRKASPAHETPMGDLIADAELEAGDPTGIAFTNEGGIRAGLAFDSGLPGVGAGKVTYGELFTAQPFGNNLVTITLTGSQIKTLLEEQFKGCAQGSPPGEKLADSNRVLEVSEGFSYSFNPDGPVCSKVDARTIRLHGKTVVPSGRYRVTVNTLLADGGEQLYVLKEGTNRKIGPRDLDAMESYFRTHGSVSPVEPHRISLMQ
jgi:5'-nucleotidase